jgi:NADPH:quinone reductase-like Zn-dependent oxidoreductase
MGAGLLAMLERLGDAVFAMMPRDLGAQAELVTIAADLAVKKPNNMSVEEASSVPGGGAHGASVAT